MFLCMVGYLSLKSCSCFSSLSLSLFLFLLFIINSLHWQSLWGLNLWVWTSPSFQISIRHTSIDSLWWTLKQMNKLINKWICQSLYRSPSFQESLSAALVSSQRDFKALFRQAEKKWIPLRSVLGKKKHEIQCWGKIHMWSEVWLKSNFFETRLRVRLHNSNEKYHIHIVKTIAMSNNS